jgi:hypothetical protein
LNLDQGGKIVATYIWIGGNGMDLRNKARVSIMQNGASMIDLPFFFFLS